MAGRPPTRTTVAMWRLCADLSLTRWLVSAAALLGILATARLTIAPPSPHVSRQAPAAVTDLAAEGFAEQFTRTLLTYDAGHADTRERTLAAFAGAGMDPDAGLQPPATGAQRVGWTRVVQQRDVSSAEHVYTVAVQTDRSGLLHLAVDVRRDGRGTLRLGGYPALVGAPVSAPVTRDPDAGLRDVNDPALEEVVARALRNYLAGASDQLVADLAPGARVATPGLRVHMTGLADLKWSANAGWVIATASGQGRTGERWTLRYELEVQRTAGRWEIGAIEIRPDG